MKSQVDDMRSLVESLVASAVGVRASEQDRVAAAATAAQARGKAFTERARAMTAQMHAVDVSIAGMTTSRMVRTVADFAARTTAEAARVFQADADMHTRVADVNQMNANTDAAVTATTVARHAQEAADLAARTAAEAARVFQAAADMDTRTAEVNQMNADTDAAVAASTVARHAQEAADLAARTTAEAARLAEADADMRTRVADVNQMNTDTDAAVAEMTASHMAKAELLHDGLAAIGRVRSGLGAGPATKAKPAKRAKPAQAAKPAKPTAAAKHTPPAKKRASRPAASKAVAAATAVQAHEFADDADASGDFATSS